MKKKTRKEIEGICKKAGLRLCNKKMTKQEIEKMVKSGTLVGSTPYGTGGSKKGLVDPKAKNPFVKKPKKKVEGALKLDSNKVRFDLFPVKPLFYLARLFTTGAIMHGDRNWEKGFKWGRIFRGIVTHLFKFWMGEWMDEETKVPHLTNAAWGCIVLTEFHSTHPELDDRVKCRDFKKFLDEVVDVGIVKKDFGKRIVK